MSNRAAEHDKTRMNVESCRLRISKDREVS